MSEPADYVLPVVYHDLETRLRRLFDAALELRGELVAYAQRCRREGNPHLAARMDTELERLDAALADAQEVLT